MPLSTTPLTSKPHGSLQLDDTHNSSGNPAGITIEAGSNQRIFRQTETASSGMCSEYVHLYLFVLMDLVCYQQVDILYASV